MRDVSFRETVVTDLGKRVAVYRKRTYELFYPSDDGEWERYVDFFIMTLIAANVAAVMVGTVDSIQNAYVRELRYFEVISVAVFSVEYTARIWSGVEGLEDRVGKNPLFDRIKIAKRPMMIIDLLAILPFFLARAGLGLDLRFLRALRLIRFLRLLKLVRYSESMRAFGRAFGKKKDELIVAMTANAILLVVASSLMYFVEHDAQPGAFGSIPETMWWGIVTLTTVGYGNVAPITPLGRLLGSVVAVLGIGLFALPASIMASGFVEESSYDTTVCPDCGHEIHWADDISSGKPQYEVGDIIRIDISKESDLPYRFHGEHGRIVATPSDGSAQHLDTGDGYRVELLDIEKTLETECRDLRSPIQFPPSMNVSSIEA